jgi:hypothetical protein
MELSNVKLVFLPPNMTTGTQPLDSGIIQNFKVKYRKMLLEFLLSHEDVTTLVDAIKKVNVGDVVGSFKTRTKSLLQPLKIAYERQV